MRGDGSRWRGPFNGHRTVLSRRREPRWIIDDRRRDGFDLRQRLGHNRMVTFFISRLPENWNSKLFLSEMKKKGPAVEAFIISKKDKHGLRFGFARFELGINVEAMTKELGQLVVNGVKLFAKPARFNKNGIDTTEFQKKGPRTQVWTRLGGSEGRRVDNLSFADVVKGNQGNQRNVKEKSKEVGDAGGSPIIPKSKEGPEFTNQKTGENEAGTTAIKQQTLEANQMMEDLKTQHEPENAQKPWFKIVTDDIEDPLENLDSCLIAEMTR